MTSNAAERFVAVGTVIRITALVHNDRVTVFDYFIHWYVSMKITEYWRKAEYKNCVIP